MREYLTRKDGDRDLFCELVLGRQAGAHVVTEEKGTRGTSQLRRVVQLYLGPDRGQADATFAERLRLRRIEGYGAASDAGLASVPVGKREKLAQAAWLPTDVSELELELLLVDPDWMAQEKEDGVHVIAYRLHGSVVATNRRGEVIELPRILAGALSKLPDGYAVDGEYLHRGPRLKLFDTLHTDRGDLREEPYLTRWRATLDAVRRMKSPWVGSVRSAMTEKDKRALLASLRRQQAEGAIFKRLDATYTAGRPARGGTMRRLKFRHRADVIVTRRRGDTTASFEMFVMFQGQAVSAGTVSARTHYSQVKPGESRVAEVSYLYASAEYRLVQTTLERLRDDKAKEECLRDQLVVGKKFLERAG